MSADASVGPGALRHRLEVSVLHVELDLPDGLLPLAAARQLTDLLRQPPAEAHLLVLRSVGPSFCLGRERTAANPHDLPGEVQVLVDLNDALSRTRLVTVAAVAGDAAGFGVGLAALCDVAVAAHPVTFSFPEVRIGLAPTLVLAWLARTVGRRAAFWLTATGEPVSAPQAVELGLLNAAVPEAELDDAVAAHVSALLQHPPRVHAEIRDMLRVASGLNAQQAHELAADRLVVGSLRRAGG